MTSDRPDALAIFLLTEHRMIHSLALLERAARLELFVPRLLCAFGSGMTRARDTHKRARSLIGMPP